MERFVKEFADYLGNLDSSSMMKKEFTAARKTWRDTVLRHYEHGSITAVEAVKELLRAPEDRMHTYTVLVRFPESDRPDWVDVVMFTSPMNIGDGSSTLEQESLEFYQQHDPDGADRLTRIESSFDMVANKYGGTWCYLDQDVQPLEVE